MEKWVMLFFAYSIIGWIIEVVDNYIEKGRFINRGFLIGPYCPIYGCGGLLITIFLEKYSNDILVLFILSMVLCAVLEYFTSYIMEKLFHIRWWNYTNYKFNINGRICLEMMIPFGFLGVILICYINPILNNIFNAVSINLFNVCTYILMGLFILDSIVSLRIIFGLEDIVTNVKQDSTEKVTNQVRKIIIDSNKELYHRIIDAFPKLQIFNNFKKIIHKK